MIEFLKKWFGPEPPDEMKLIGQVKNPITWVPTGSETTEKTTLIILLFMSDKGRRYVQWPDDHPKGILTKLKAWPKGQELSAWEKGGLFPEAFEPITDTLGPMLRRIVDINMGLTNEETTNGPT